MQTQNLEFPNSYIDSLKRIIELINNNFKTYREWDGKDFHKTVTSALECVCNVLTESGILNEGDCYFDKIPATYSLYSEVILLTLQGKRSEGFNLFREKLYPTLQPYNGSRKVKSKLQEQKKEAYRIRCISSYMSNLERGDLFHVPFQLIHYIENSRFSICGFPSLYLSSSAYGAWEELGRPDLKECYFSRFNIDLKTLNFIDLTVSPCEVYIELKNLLNGFHLTQEPKVKNQFLLNIRSVILSYFYAWPTILCSSYKVRHQAPFKVEYIFPQILLECLLSDKDKVYDGIMFKSTKSLALRGHLEQDTSNRNTNYVIPAKNYSASGFCNDLSKKIPLTEPINYALHQLISPHASTINKDKPQPYDTTVFGDIESILLSKPIDFVC
ncbi:hypothetical protein Q2Y20_000043 [Vibrio parahaemolyticus]|nr:hypothetical protein [Vibrio parahaemolyticus]ELA8378803.1 hypothetical protein [Vibrio parahaemolyticus]HCG6889436.1 hypothetical protein [Vibrio parahaemolyticus]HCG7628979.1 hypothetical protein [Vibrio parahaemolyticus]